MNLQELARRHLHQRSALSHLLLPLGNLNAALQTLRRSRFQGWRAPCRVVSVGNLGSGGSGKTPFCVYLALLLQEMGIKVALSHRGCGGSRERFPSLVSNRSNIILGVKDSGDEAQLLAQKLPGIPVVVGKRRVAAISLLLAEYPDLDVVILDDGFQHLKIARDLDLVCFDAKLGLGNGRVIPAGWLREPLSALQSADALVLIQKEAQTPSLGNLPASARTALKCFYQALDVIDSQGNAFPLDILQNRKLVLISSIALPDSFEDSVHALGLNWETHFRFPDHHPFSQPAEIDPILQALGDDGVLLCTEKDLPKLALHKSLNPLALRMKLVCADEPRLKRLVLEKVRDGD
ncbi:MAG: tetraacyldisaccharide 4'-kinase [Desulfobulbus sp.]|nr:tetraacyldisaccharide 4'-kinase [Desulfobulbus sp.]NLN85212.1 tetraacyldisaccharide 4'-kinase [Candidatus Cloacimonadota bacterium]